MMSDIILAIYMAIFKAGGPVLVVISYLHIVPEYPKLGWGMVVFGLILSFLILKPVGDGDEI